MISIRSGSCVGINSNMPLAHLQMPWIVHEEGSFFEHTPSFINEKHFYDYLKGEIGTSDDENSLASELLDRKSTRLNSSHVAISYAVFCFKKNRSLYLYCSIHKCHN